ncbi:MAG: CHASE2 domain-containing protein [Acidobacteriia bacterium]|nr:CHASE2 domain-containing protein [Terriglobia bacterium]
MRRWEKLTYTGLLAACLLVSLVIGNTTLGVQLDNDVYDFLFRLQPEDRRETASIILGIDEQTLSEMGALRNVRRILAEGLERASAAGPAAIVLDMILADAGDPQEDAHLAAALAGAPNLVLATDLTRQGQWEDPIEAFRRTAAGIGHVHADPDQFDNVVRRIPLEKSSARDRRFALSLEALRIARASKIVESPDGLDVGGQWIPAARTETEPRPILIRYRRIGAIPEVSFWALKNDASAAARLKGKVVFVGMTAQSAAQDRHMTPFSFGQTMPGVEIHANAYETLQRGEFLVAAGNLTVILFCAGLALAAGLIFYRLQGRPAYLWGAALLVVAHLAPYGAFAQGVVFPYSAPIGTAWFTLASAASFQHFVVRRRLLRAQEEKGRYQQAMHFVAHEMRSPLSAIQGSSEMMGRYKLGEEKRAEMARMINSESKRMARMIQTFLDVERLTGGQMELKREIFSPSTMVRTCIERAQPLAERKRMTIATGKLDEVSLTGDRELMEYAFYNLLTNAVKYSNPGTEVIVTALSLDGNLRLAVRDQGIGMDAKEIKSVFQKFYRTKKAEASGEAGTGIGLSIVEQIVTHHGGSMEVESQPGAGSCFTMVLPAQAAVTEGN